MSEGNLLQRTAQLRDIFDLGTCAALYDLCNDRQFEHMDGSDFVNFLNLKPTRKPVVRRDKEKRRLCYLILAVSLTVKPQDLGREWSKAFLKQCGIDFAYYIRHRNDVAAKDATEMNAEFCKSVDDMLRNLRKTRQNWP